MNFTFLTKLQIYPVQVEIMSFTTFLSTNNKENKSKNYIIDFIINYIKILKLYNLIKN